MWKAAGLAAALVAFAAMAPDPANASGHTLVGHDGHPHAFASCAPETLVHIVVRDVTPGTDPASFAGQPRSFYRLDNDRLRSDEADDPAQHLHQLLIVAEPDIWIVNLDDGSGIHAVDPGPTLNAHAPAITGEGVSPVLTQLEFGCEAGFIDQHGLQRARQEMIQGAAYDVYRLSADGDAAEILMKAGAATPGFIRYFRAGKLLLMWRYELYEQGLKADPSLFAAPAGVKFQEQRTQ